MKKIRIPLILIICTVLFASINSMEASRGTWKVDSLDEGENGVVVANLICKYSLFTKECDVGMAREIIGAPPELL